MALTTSEVKGRMILLTATQTLSFIDQTRRTHFISSPPGVCTGSQQKSNDFLLLFLTSNEERRPPSLQQMIQTLFDRREALTLSLRSRFAPAASNTDITCIWPLLAAKWSALHFS
jgi:hypothetical protein